MPPFPKPTKQPDQPILISESVLTTLSTSSKSNQSIEKLSTKTNSSGSIEGQSNIKTELNDVAESAKPCPDKCPPTGLSIISTKPEPNSEENELSKQPTKTTIQKEQEDISFELKNSIISTLSQISNLAKNEKPQSLTDSSAINASLVPPNPPPLPPPLPQLPKQLLDQQQNSSDSNPSEITTKRSQSVKSVRPAPAVPTRAYLPLQNNTSPVDLINLSHIMPAESTMSTGPSDKITTDIQAIVTSASTIESNNTSTSNLTKKVGYYRNTRLLFSSIVILFILEF